MAAQFFHALVEQGNRAAFSVKVEEAKTLPVLYAFLDLLLREAELCFLREPCDGDGNLCGLLQVLLEVEKQV